jgi:WD40 repeat protein
VLRLTVDPTGRRAAWTAAKSTAVYTFDFSSRKAGSLPGGNLEPTAVRFSPDGNILAVGGRDEIVQLWYYRPEADLSFLPDPARAAIQREAGPSKIQSAEKVMEGWKVNYIASTTGTNTIAVVTADGKLQWKGEDKDNPWPDSVSSGEPVAAEPMRAHSDTVLDLAFLRGTTGLNLISAGADGRLVRWNLDADFLPALRYTTPAPAAFVAGLRRVTVDAARTSLLVQDSRGEIRPIPYPGADGVAGIDVSGDGHLAAIRLANGAVDLFDLNAGKHLPQKLSATNVKSRLVKPATDERGFIHDADSDILSAKLNNAGTLLAWFAGRELFVAPLGGLKATNWVAPEAAEGYYIASFAFDGNALITGDNANHISAWELPDEKRPAAKCCGEEAMERTHQTAVDIAPGPHSSFVILDEDHALQFSGLANTDETPRLRFPGQPQRVGFSADGKWFHVLLAGGNERKWAVQQADLRKDACAIARRELQYAKTGTLEFVGRVCR